MYEKVTVRDIVNLDSLETLSINNYSQFGGNTFLRLKMINGLVCVSDMDKKVICRLDPVQACLSKNVTPYCICHDQFNVFIFDDNASIFIFDQEHCLTFSVRCGNISPGRFIYCFSNLLIITHDDFISIFDFKGQLVREFGSFGSGIVQFDGIGGVVVNSKGEIIIVDRNNKRVQVVTQRGDYLYSFHLQTKVGGYGICTDQEDNILVANEDYHVIHVFTRNGVPIRNIFVLYPRIIEICQGKIIVKTNKQKIYILQNYILSFLSVLKKEK